MADCLEKLDRSIDCNPDVISPGIKNRVIIVNYDDIDRAACMFDAVNNAQMKSIALKSGSPTLTAFYMDGQKNSFTKDCTEVDLKYTTAWNHKITGFIFDNDPLAKKTIQQIANGKFVVIVENIYDNVSKVGAASDSLFEVYGYANGLNGKSITNSNADARGGWYFELVSLADYPEPKICYSLYDGVSAATTRTAVENLL
jgi:hypothetical protein